MRPTVPIQGGKQQAFAHDKSVAQTPLSNLRFDGRETCPDTASKLLHAYWNNMPMPAMSPKSRDADMEAALIWCVQNNSMDVLAELQQAHPEFSIPVDLQSAADPKKVLDELSNRGITCTIRANGDQHLDLLCAYLKTPGCKAWRLDWTPSTNGVSSMCEAIKDNNSLTSVFLPSPDLGEPPLTQLCEAIAENRNIVDVSVVVDDTNTSDPHQLNALFSQRRLNSIRIETSFDNHHSVSLMESALQAGLEADHGFPDRFALIDPKPYATQSVLTNVVSIWTVLEKGKGLKHLELPASTVKLNDDQKEQLEKLVQQHKTLISCRVGVPTRPPSLVERAKKYNETLESKMDSGPKGLSALFERDAPAALMRYFQTPAETDIGTTRPGLPRDIQNEIADYLVTRDPHASAAYGIVNRTIARDASTSRYQETFRWILGRVEKGVTRNESPEAVHASIAEGLREKNAWMFVHEWQAAINSVDAQTRGELQPLEAPGIRAGWLKRLEPAQAREEPQ